MIVFTVSPEPAAVTLGQTKPDEDDGHTFGHTANFVSATVSVNVLVNEINGAASGVYGL